MRLMGYVIALLCALPLAAAVRADEPADTDVEADESGDSVRIADITREVRKLGDWDSFYEMASPGIDEFWQQHDWNEEADRFALQTLHDIASIPPWEFQKRFEALTGAVRSRYDLSDQQFHELQSRIYGMVGAMAWRHGRTILNHTREMVRTRTSGQPFTPEQVARWTHEGAGIFDDARTMFDNLSAAMAESLTPEQREIYKRDMASYHKRMQAVDELRKRWEAGDWRPADWGLQHDPIHEPLVEQGRVKDAANASAERGSVSAFDESSWAKYVRAFVQRYQLNDPQAESAWSILHELEERAADYRKTHRDDPAEGDGDTDSDTAVNDYMLRLFDELARRLHPLPTEDQRRRALLTESPPAPPVEQAAAGSPGTPLAEHVPPE